jgi:hypothetical protein
MPDDDSQSLLLFAWQRGHTMLIGLVGRIGTDGFDFGMKKNITPGRPDKMGWYRDPLVRLGLH